MWSHKIVYIAAVFFVYFAAEMLWLPSYLKVDFNHLFEVLAIRQAENGVVLRKIVCNSCVCWINGAERLMK